MSKITRFETLVERLVEGTFARLFAGRLSPSEVATHLVRAMEDNQVTCSDEKPHAPTHYHVFIHPDDYAALVREQPALAQELANHVIELAAQAELVMATTPSVSILPSPEVGSHQVRVEARWMPDDTTPMERTRELKDEDVESEIEDDVQPERSPEGSETPIGRPFLIVEGHRHVDLLQPVTSIGRALDNDVIIEDPRVSRHHAQLRLRYGHYVLYDLESSGGTSINDYPIEECVLHAGDVISLAGVQIIYSEDPPTPIPLPTDQDTPSLASSSARENEPT